MAPINCFADGINVPEYREIMWKSDFSEDHNPQFVVYWLHIWSERKKIVKVPL
jgi:hypothetical protein